jgi:two-component system, OmpR family, response regulator RegX3
MRVLVVDDEVTILDAVTYALEREGFEVEQATDGEAGLERARSRDFDVVLLDLMLPKLTGTEVARRLRAESTVPIVMLTAKSAEVDRVLGLEVGADDYVTKPFSMAELVARLNAIVRRRELDRTEGHATARRIGGIDIDFVRHAVHVDGARVHLTQSEFRLLALLSSQPERVFTRRELIQELWRSEFVGDERACDTHVVNLRRKVERDATNPERIVTVRGVGYKLVPV